MRGKPRRSHVEIRQPFRRSARAAAGRLASVAAATLLLVAAAPAPAPQSKEEVDRQLIEKAIEAVRDIRLHIDEATPHEVARGIFAFGPKFKVYPKDSDAYVLAVEYLLTDQCWKKKRIFDEKDGEVRLRPLGDRKKKKIITEKLPHEFLMMLGVFGQIPLNDAIVGRYCADEFRARVLAVR